MHALSLMGLVSQEKRLNSLPSAFDTPMAAGSQVGRRGSCPVNFRVPVPWHHKSPLLSAK